MTLLLHTRSTHISKRYTNTKTRLGITQQTPRQPKVLNTEEGPISIFRHWNVWTPWIEHSNVWRTSTTSEPRITVSRSIIQVARAFHALLNQMVYQMATVPRPTLIKVKRRIKGTQQAGNGHMNLFYHTGGAYTFTKSFNYLLIYFYNKKEWEKLRENVRHNCSRHCCSFVLLWITIHTQEWSWEDQTNIQLSTRWNNQFFWIHSFCQTLCHLFIDLANSCIKLCTNCNTVCAISWSFP